MSPYLRSMLEDAADDSGRPARLDLDAVRAGGRRAIWRQRATVGGLGAGVTAVIATVAITVGGTTPTPQLPSDQGGVHQADVDPVLQQAGLNNSAGALVNAIRAAGYDVELDHSSGAGSGGSGSEGETSGAAIAVTFGLIQGQTQGTLVVADFSAIAVLSQLVAEAANSPVDAGSDPSCAVDPDVTQAQAFAWAPCDTQLLGDGEIWSSSGSGTGVEAAGATLVRGDGSGFSVTLATTPTDSNYMEAGAAGPVPPPPLVALPLSSAELAAVVAKMAVFDEPLLADFHDEAALPGETAAPSPADPTDAADVSTESPAAGPSTDCPAGESLGEFADEVGQTSLLQADGQVYACTTTMGSTSPADVDELRAIDPVYPRDGLATLSLTPPCGGGDCRSALHYGANIVPAGVARISYRMPDGVVADAYIVAGVWVFRYLETGTLAEEQRITVQAYDDNGGLLLEGDVSN